MKVHRAKHNAKAVSSYLLSGINIKRMIAEEAQLSQQIPNISDANILKISKRPIFKIIKDKDEEQSDLPSKTFKIRSFTRKLRKHPDENAALQNEMFEKVQKLRHLKSVNNRIELFNLSAIAKFRKDPRDAQKTENSEKEYCKMRQVLVSHAHKWRTSSQVIAKQRIIEKQLKNNLPCKHISLEFSNLNTERYRELACKISTRINRNRQKTESSVLLIISLEALQVTQRRAVKSSKLMYQQQAKQEKYKGKFSSEIFEAIKLFTSKEWPLSAVSGKVRLAFKVNSWQESEELREKLQSHEVEDYHCIFYPNRKYSEIFNLYQIDPLLGGISKLILIEHKPKLGYQFPIVSNLQSIVFSNYNETFLTLTKISQTLKSFLAVYQLQHKQAQLKQPQQKQLEAQILESEEQPLDNSLIFTNPTQPKSQYEIRYQQVQLSSSQLQARLNFALQSRLIRKQVLQKLQKGPKLARRALDDKTQSINNISQSVSLESHKNQRQLRVDRFSLQKMQENIQTKFTNRTQNTHFKPTLPKPPSSSKNEEIDQITCSVLQKHVKCRAASVEVAQLVKKNQHIFKQIQQYLARVALLQHSATRYLARQNDKEAQDKIIQSSPLPMSIKCIKVL